MTESSSRPAQAAHIVVTSPLPPEDLAAMTAGLDSTGEVTLLPPADDPSRKQVLSEADVLVSWHPDREISDDDWAAASRVRLLQTVSAGLDHVTFSRIPARVTVAGNSGAFGVPMAEHTIAMILALAKRLMAAHRELAEGKFDQFTQGRLIAGQTAVILGYGGIGRAVAARLRPFGVHIIGVNRSGRGDENADEMVTVDHLHEVLPRAGILVVSLPLTPATDGLLGAEELALMPTDAILVNVARGEIIDQDALYDRLVAEPNFLAGIDAWWVEPFRHGRFEIRHPFFDLPNLLGSPHNSGAAPGANLVGARRVGENIAHFLRGEPMVGVAGPDYRYRP
jgi:glycerate dehydrogenase